MGVTAIVPVKALSLAKSRLAPHLDPSGRRELVAHMLSRVLDACAASAELDDVLVVAGDAAAAELARRPGVRPLVEPAPGLPAALAAADRATADRPGTLVVVADLPLVTAAELDAVCAAGRAARWVVVAATGDGGTGALLRRPAGVTPTAFGPRSAQAHLGLAKAAGLPATLLRLPGLALDVDTPAELRAAARRDPGLAGWAGLLADRTSRAAPPPPMRVACDGQEPPTTGAQGMPQGTVKHFDPETGTGTVLLDNQDELPIDAETFAASGLMELRLGQRVRFRVTTERDTQQVRDLTLVSL